MTKVTKPAPTKTAATKAAPKKAPVKKAEPVKSLFATPTPAPAAKAGLAKALGDIKDLAAGKPVKGKAFDVGAKSDQAAAAKPVTNARVRKTADKPAPVAPVSKEEPKAVELVRIFGQAGKAQRYSGLTSDRKAFSAYTVAALIVSGHVVIAGKGAPTKAAGVANVELFRRTVGQTAAHYWMASGRISAEGITSEGLNEVQARLNGMSKGYNTDAETVEAFVAAMRKGGEAKTADGKTYNMDTEIAARKV